MPNYIPNCRDESAHLPEQDVHSHVGESDHDRRRLPQERDEEADTGEGRHRR